MRKDFDDKKDDDDLNIKIGGEEPEAKAEIRFQELTSSKVKVEFDDFPIWRDKTNMFQPLE